MIEEGGQEIGLSKNWKHEGAKINPRLGIRNLGRRDSAGGDLGWRGEVQIQVKKEDNPSSQNPPLGLWNWSGIKIIKTEKEYLMDGRPLIQAPCPSPESNNHPPLLLPSDSLCRLWIPSR